MKHIYIIFALTLVALGVSAQDVHLSQYYMNELNLNPARTGDYNGDIRLTGNYRSQWAQIGDPLTTFMVGVEKKVIIHSHTLDLGLLLVHDKFGGFKTNLNKVQLSAAYELQTKAADKFRVGVQGGVIHRATDLEAYSFPNQWNYPGGKFDTGLSSNEVFADDKDVSLDINAGVSWSRQFTKLIPTIGFSLHHINQPVDSYFKDAEKLDIRYIASGEFVYMLSPKFYIEPKAFYMTTTSTNDMIVGSNFRYLFTHKPYPLSIYAGAHNRGDFSEDNDAIIGTIGGQYKQWELGVSYDYNTSTLSADTDRKSSFELAVRYITPSNRSNYISLPCDRF